jgi:pimeloyl-ACP methyl ester carboxylesterase
MAFVRTGGLRLRYREWGASNHPEPFVLIHGAGASSLTWLDVGRTLGATRRRAIAIDLPGHGQSSAMPHEARPSIETYRDMVGLTCASLGVAKAVVCGHSMGGAIALSCALAYPDRVAGLVLVATGARLPASPQFQAALTDRATHLPDLLAATCYSPATPRDLARRWSSALVAAPREVVLADFGACGHVDLRKHLAALRVPTLVVAGADDLMTPVKLARELAEGIPGARLLILPDAGHNLIHEHAGRVARAMLTLLQAPPLEPQVAIR